MSKISTDNMYVDFTVDFSNVKKKNIDIFISKLEDISFQMTYFDGDSKEVGIINETYSDKRCEKDIKKMKKKIKKLMKKYS